jgi:hypothetical protein
VCKVLVGKPERDQGVDGRMGSELISRRLGGGV